MLSKSGRVGLLALSSAISAVVAQSPIATLPSNISLTSQRPSASPLPTGSSCCVLFADGVGLNFWWNQTATAYTATVITQYIEYNNTILTELATVTNENATTGPIPTDIVKSHNEYRRTEIGTQTMASYETTAIASPTPHLNFVMFMYLSGSWVTETQSDSSCLATGAPVGWVYLPTPYIYVEEPPVTRTDNAFLPAPPSDIIEKAVSQDPSLLKEWPSLTECELISGTGQPTVHVPVTALTSHTSTTIRKAGPAPTPTTRSEDQATKVSSIPTASEGDTTSKAQVEPTAVPQPTLPAHSQLSSDINDPNGNIPISSLPQEPQQGPAPIETGLPLPSEAPSRPINSGVADSKSALPFPIVPAPTSTDAGFQGQPTNAPQPGAVVLPGGETLKPGQATTVSGVVVSVPTQRPAHNGASQAFTVADGFTTKVPIAAPIVVVDGSTVTLPTQRPTPATGVLVTLGSQIFSFQGPAAPNSGVMLPNSETLSMGATTIYAGQTLVATVVTSGTNVATVIEAVDESTTQTLWLPTVTPSSPSSNEPYNSTETSADAPEFTGGVELDKTGAWALLIVLGTGVITLM